MTPRRAVVLLTAVIALTATATAVALVAIRDRGSEPRGTGSWEKVPFARTGLDAGARIRSVTETDVGLIAVGYTEHFGEPLTQLGDFIEPGLWTSTDGRRWRALPTDQFGTSMLESLVETSNGLFLFGRPFQSGEAPLTIWRSNDGARWEQLTTDAPSGIRYVVADRRGFVAAGGEREGDPSTWSFRTRIWTSEDGRNWDRVPGDEQLFPPGLITSLASNGRGFVAVGVEQAPEGGIEEPFVGPVGWTSSDGVRWHRIGRGRDFDAELDAPASVIADGDGYILFAQGTTEEGAEPATTTTTLPPTTTTITSDDGSTSSVVRLCAEGTGTAVVLGSPDGTRWTGLSSERSPATAIATSAHGRLLTAGSEGTCESSSIGVYISEDGRHWKRAIPKPRGGGLSDTYPMALGASRDGAVLVVGELLASESEASGPAVWIWTAP